MMAEAALGAQVETRAVQVVGKRVEKEVEVVERGIVWVVGTLAGSVVEASGRREIFCSHKKFLYIHLAALICVIRWVSVNTNK